MTTNIKAKKTVGRQIKKRDFYFCFLIILFIGILFLSGCAVTKQIPKDDLVVWITKGNDIVPGMESLHVRYRGVPKAEASHNGHSIIWKTPVGLSGVYRFNDPSDGAIYGDGNWQEEWKRAAADNEIHPGELPLVYYLIGYVRQVNGKLQLAFPNKTRLIFQPPKPFSVANHYIIIELPDVPPKADEKF
jgi:hypothetical protein